MKIENQSNTNINTSKSETTPELKALYIKEAERKLLRFTEHLVKKHNNAGGLYFNFVGEDKYTNKKLYKPVKTTPKAIAVKILPYLLWVTHRYMSRYYGVDHGFFTFSKTPDPLLKDIYNLSFKSNEILISNLTILMLFMNVAFEDAFTSDESNKVVLNQLYYLVSQKSGDES